MSQVNSAYAELKQKFARVGHLHAAQGTLNWESRTTMPDGAAETRGIVLGTLTEVATEEMQQARLGDLLERAEQEESEALDDWEMANLREMRRRWRRETVIPVKLASRISNLRSVGQMVWQKARRENDFASFAETLAEMLELQREVARIKSDAFGVAPYDALVDDYEPGLTCADIDPVFDDLAIFLPKLMRQIIEHQARQDPIIELPGPFAESEQLAFSRRLAEMIGFDFHHGRIDTTVHPFASGMPGDVRITTRFSPDDLLDGIQATVHETGHAMYESGLPKDWAFQPVGHARGTAMHESQSLLMEMQASRSKQFVGVLGKMLRETFGDGSEAWSDANIMRHYRRVRPSLIRVEADEVTYPLHVILRYRIERALIGGDLEVADIPSTWNDLHQELIGITPPDDRRGCLQDVHWSAGLFGYFPTYSLGAVMAAQLFATATKQDPAILEGLGKGDFKPLLAWTGKHVHSQGSRLASSSEVLEAATGSKLTTEPFKAHLRKRYLEE